MTQLILITGGAGFLGSHVATELLDRGYSVRILDNLTPQVHGEHQKPPVYLDERAELQIGDVRNPVAVRRALEGADSVVHFAARVGVGQSMYEIADYVSVNCYGTAVLLDEIIRRPIERMVVASSMSIYGEGACQTPEGQPARAETRTAEQMRAGRWELWNGQHQRLIPIPTPETKIPCLSSIYALSKYDQEQLCLLTGRAYNIPTVALRFFNAYGPHQALSNPYTGVLAIFAARLLNGKAPLVNENGLQQRDFVSVYDIARATRLALETPLEGQEVLNIGSGTPRTICSIAEQLIRALGRDDIEPEITGEYRAGDIRHCYADISLAREKLGYEPEIDIEDGIYDLVEWLKHQEAQDRVAESRAELEERGLLVR